jgi:2-polyprenyl-3-methyl-5-hydroxy-6-metoxy-1,4-benzoquinol methylase
MERKVRKRFAFGSNWANFSRQINESNIEIARKSIQTTLGNSSLEGKSFLDIGCGSGIFTVAALQMGANNVYSFDFDNESVDTTLRNLNRFNSKLELNRVHVSQGDILNIKFVEALPQFDIVYSWGVLHHTGNLWKALENTISKISVDGLGIISLYNDQGISSKVWRIIKKLYVNSPVLIQKILISVSILRLWGPTFIKSKIQPSQNSKWQNYKLNRGMNPYVDIIDWVGGYPFEFAKREAVISFLREKGFEARVTKSAKNGIGCNEFLITRSAEK